MAEARRGLDLKQSQSPLADLVRRTSSRRIKRRQSQSQSHLQNDERSLSINTPHSPLLHTHFARDSTATASSFDDNSYLDTSVRSSDYGYRCEDEDESNVFWDKPDATFHNLNSENVANIQHLFDASSQQEQDPWQVKGVPPSSPSVFISLHDPPMNNRVNSATIRDGPIVKPVTNFSRPTRESGQPEHAGAVGERVTPQLPPDMREQKLKVLERNGRRYMTGSSAETMKAQSPLSQTTTAIQNGTSPGSPGMTSVVKTFKLNVTLILKMTGWSESTQLQVGGRSSPSTRKLYLQLPPIISSNVNLHPQSRSTEGDIRTVSPVSLYTTTYYESESPSPSGNRPQAPTRPSSGTAEVERPQKSPMSLKSLNVFSPRSPEAQRTPQEYLQLGIQHHEANRLRESARCFERSANEEGGCGVGMLMYGLTLRHGWGCAKNEKAGFKWLRKAAEHAVEDLEKVRMNGDMDVRVIKASLNVLYLIYIYIDWI